MAEEHDKNSDLEQFNHNLITMKKNDLSSENDDSLTKITRLQNEILIAQKMIALREQEIKQLTEPNIDLSCDSDTDLQTRKAKQKEMRRINEQVKINAAVEKKSRDSSRHSSPYSSSHISRHPSRHSSTHKTGRETVSNSEGKNCDASFSERSWDNDNEISKEEPKQRMRKPGKNCRRNHQRNRRRNLRQKNALERKVKRMIENKDGTENTEGSESSQIKNIVPTKDVENKCIAESEQISVATGEKHNEQTDNVGEVTDFNLNREQLIHDLEEYSISESEDSEESTGNDLRDGKTQDEATKKRKRNGINSRREYQRKRRIAYRRRDLERQMKEMIENERIPSTLNKNITPTVEGLNAKKEASKTNLPPKFTVDSRKLSEISEKQLTSTNRARGETNHGNARIIVPKTMPAKYDNSQQRKQKTETEIKRSNELVKRCVGVSEKKTKTVPTCTAVSCDPNSKEIVLNHDEIIRFLGEHTSSEPDLQNEEEFTKINCRTGQNSSKLHRANQRGDAHQKSAIKNKIKYMVDNNRPVKITERELYILNYCNKNEGDMRLRNAYKVEENKKDELLEQLKFTTDKQSCESNNEEISPECDILNFI